MSNNKVHATPYVVAVTKSKSSKPTCTTTTNTNGILNTNRFNLLLERLPLHFKLFCIVVFAFVSMIAMAAVLISNSSQQLMASELITKLSTITTVMADLVHFSQLERGASSLFLGDSGSSTYKLRMFECRNNTDIALKAFLEVKPRMMRDLDRNNPKYGPVIEGFAVVDDFISEFSTLRINIDKLNFAKSITAINFFTNWNTAMIEAITLLNNLSEDSNFMILQSAFNILIQMKEFTGQKRAIGSAAYASHSMSHDVLLQYLQAQSRGSYNQRSLKLKDVFSIWDFFNRTVLSTTYNGNTQVMEQYLVNNYQNLYLYTGSDWFQNMTLHMNNMRVVEIFVSNLSMTYGASLNQQSTGSMVAFILASVVAAMLSAIVAMIFSKSIASPWKKITELQRLQEMYKSFIPAHVLLQIENNDEKGSFTDLDDGTTQEKSMSHEQIIPIMTPNELVHIIQDFFERVEYVSKSTGSLMEPSTNFGITISFNASKDQAKHDERAVRACVDLSERLKELQKNQWNQIANGQIMSACDFRLAVHVQLCLCGNVGTNDTKVFKIVGPIHENLDLLLDCARSLQVRVVCDEYLAKKVVHSTYHTRFISFINLHQECVQNRKVYEIGAKLEISADEWFYELAIKQKNEQWVKYNTACSDLLENNWKKALIGFEEYEAEHECDLPTKQMIKLCRKELPHVFEEEECEPNNYQGQTDSYF